MNADGFLSVTEAARKLGKTRKRARKWLLEMAERHPEVRLLVMPNRRKWSGWLWVDPNGLAKLK